MAGWADRSAHPPIHRSDEVICHEKTSSWNAPPVRVGIISRPRTGGSIRSGRSGTSTAPAATSRWRTRNRNSRGDGSARAEQQAAEQENHREPADRFLPRGARGNPEGHLAHDGGAAQG